MFLYTTQFYQILLFHTCTLACILFTPLFTLKQTSSSLRPSKTTSKDKTLSILMVQDVDGMQVPKMNAHQAVQNRSLCLQAERIYIDWGQEEELLLRFATLLSPSTSGSDNTTSPLLNLPNNRAPTGWSSWYFYYEHVSQVLIDETLRKVISHPQLVTLDYIQLGKPVFCRISSEIRLFPLLLIFSLI